VATSVAPIKNDASKELASEVMREFQTLAGKRGIWEKHWEDVAKKVLPHYSTTFYSQGNPVPGQERGDEQYDVTANLALWKFAAAMESMLTPATGRWHRLRPPDPALLRDRATALWFDQVNDLMFHYRYAPRSGYQAQQHEAYVSIGAFGTSCIFTDQYNDPCYPKTRGLRYRNVHLGECFFATNHQGIVDKCYRRFKMTLRQIAQKWGEDALKERYGDKLKTNPEDEVFIIHAVTPNMQYDPKRLDKQGKRYHSRYVIKDTMTLLEDGGYRTFPYSVARYMTAPGELYGRSPAMNVLPSIRVLDEEKKTMLKAGHRAVDPVLLAHDDGVLEGFNLKPGAINYGGVNSQGQPLVHALQVGNPQIGKELMDDERAGINDAFLVTLFQILIETPQMTATEVLERARETGALLSPTMGRYQSEGIGPMVEREFDLLMFQGLIPPPPRKLLQAGGEYKVEYDAPLNRAMKAEYASGAMRTFQWATEMAAQMQDPSLLDVFDGDAMITDIADINGVPFKYLRDPQMVAQIRQQRQQQQAVQQITQALPGMAAMAKAASPKGTSAAPGQPDLGQ
jgi:hypothetical protein